MTLEHVSGLIYAKFRTGPRNNSFIPVSGTPGTNDLFTLISDFMSGVNGMMFLHLEDYAHPDLREEVDLQQFRIAESASVLSTAHLRRFRPASVTKMNQGDVRIAIHTVAMAVLTGNTKQPATKVHKSVKPQHVQREVNGELVDFNLKAGWHHNIHVIIAGIMSVAPEIVNLSNFGAPSYSAFCELCAQNFLTRDAWYSEPDAHFNRLSKLACMVRNNGLKTNWTSHFTKEFRVWGKLYYLLQNFSHYFIVKDEQDLAGLMVDGTRGNSWKKLFCLIPASDRLTESSCIRWKLRDDYPPQSRKMNLPPMLPVEEGGEREDVEGE